MDAYARTIERLYELQKFGIKLGLNSTENLLKGLGNPHEKLRVVHLAGTNGKGSVGAMLEAVLLEAGVRVGFYTSPHLVDFSERFRLDGREITHEEVMDLAEAVWEVTDQREQPTFFEFVTAMAFLWYARRECELLILETGMGGRLDATNVCRPLASVITNIGLEHQEYLGHRLTDIAAEKAGIIKPHVPVITGVTQPSARRVVERTADALSSPLIRLGRDIRCRRGPGVGFSLAGRLWRLPGLITNLAGRHQPMNAGLALGAAEVLSEAGLHILPKHFRAGLTRVNWPGRLEKWPTPPGEATLWLDGAHNAPAARALLDSLKTVREGRSPLVMVIGVMADKDIAHLLGLLAPAADRIVWSRPVYSRAAEPERLAAEAPPDAPAGQVEPDLGRAMARARELAGPDGVVLVTGSLFTVGEARARLQGRTISDLP